MARLKPLGFAAAIVASAHAGHAAALPAWIRWEPVIAAASTQYGVPAEWIARVIQAESGGRTGLFGRPIRSRTGAMGLMQLMPATWEDMRSRYGLGSNPDDPHDNILAGAAYLRLMYDRYGYPGLFAAYNAGPARYSNHLVTGSSLPAETRAYLKMVAGIRYPEHTPWPPVASVSLFAVRRDRSDTSFDPRATRQTVFALIHPDAPPTYPMPQPE